MPLNRQRSLTYSPAFTLVPTNECFNQCSYCNFRRDAHTANWLTLEEAQDQLHRLQGRGVCEILILSGEVHPQSSRREAWFKHIANLCELVLAAGFLPHSNVGPLSRSEMETLGAINVSMGLMLEQHNGALMQTVHRNAPSKAPDLRLQQLYWAGELQIPFTTGLLFGIGESKTDWSLGLEAIAKAHETWGHIQEVILQPYQPGSLEETPQTPCSQMDLVDAVTLARSMLPNSIAIQIPPNLITNHHTLLACIKTGATDLGGIVPHDFVNPDYAHRELSALKTQLETWGFTLQPRLPVYPQHYSKLSPRLRSAIHPWLSREKKIGYDNQQSLTLDSINLQETKH